MNKDKIKFLFIALILGLGIGCIAYEICKPVPPFDASKVKHWQPDPSGLGR